MLTFSSRCWDTIRRVTINPSTDSATVITTTMKATSQAGSCRSQITDCPRCERIVDLPPVQRYRRADAILDK